MSHESPFIAQSGTIPHEFACFALDHPFQPHLVAAALRVFSSLKAEAPRTCASGSVCTTSAPQMRTQEQCKRSSRVQVWTWLIQGFIPLIAGSHEEPGVVRKFNQVIRPGIQLRQRRVSGGDCPVVEELQEYFRAECRTSERLPSRFGPEALKIHGQIMLLKYYSNLLLKIYLKIYVIYYFFALHR